MLLLLCWFGCKNTHGLNVIKYYLHIRCFISFHTCLVSVSYVLASTNQALFPVLSTNCNVTASKAILKLAYFLCTVNILGKYFSPE